MKFHYQFMYGRMLPLIDITLEHLGRHIKTIAYVDSGALYSVFSSNIADILGMDYEKGNLLEAVGVGGRIKAYEHELKISIGGHEMAAKVLFSKEMAFTFNLIGIIPLFENFRVCFDGRQEQLEITPLQ